MINHKTSEWFNIKGLLFLRLLHDVIIGAHINVRLDDILIITHSLDPLRLLGLCSTSEFSPEAVCNLHQLLGLDLGVGQEVSLAAGPLGEGQLADGTLVTVSLTVQDLVHCKGSALTKSFGAAPTLVRLVFAVDIFVVSEVILSPEGLAAHVTGEGPLISVGPLMNHDIVRLGELSVTELADEPLLWSGGPALGVMSVILVTRVRGVSEAGAGVLEAGVELVVTKPLLEEERLAQAGGQTSEGGNVEA